jgi:hypothetical protein
MKMKRVKPNNRKEVTTYNKTYLFPYASEA